MRTGLCLCQCGLTWYATPSNYHNQMTTLNAGLKNPVYTERYPALAGLDSFLSLPLLGNCSKRKVIRPIGAQGLDRRGPAGSCRLFLGTGIRLGAR